ncbi:hypothetical protein NDN01_09080 [Sphingomonas sp. QA11]|uniref:hypothetical protein n=1 Tax=Sphingomonas sp. QA11 TaxID=2950605 RepID=UPI00234BDF31|nr:hypothetical protein [Sphingomonas sp. QA11]WCM29023.1 hypothetical protein NDN01_09080 [Sphingomonas sp. QA11]
MTATTLDQSPRATRSYRSVSPTVGWIDGCPAYRAAVGGYFSTAHDLLQFAHRVCNTGFLSPASRSALTKLEIASDSCALGGLIRKVPIVGKLSSPRGKPAISPGIGTFSGTDSMDRVQL